METPKSWRIDLQLTAFASMESSISPQRIEERLMAALRDIVIDSSAPDTDRVFGFVENLSVVPNNPGDDNA